MRQLHARLRVVVLFILSLSVLMSIISLCYYGMHNNSRRRFFKHVFVHERKDYKKELQQIGVFYEVLK
jgi:hypothetical protein